MGENVDSWREKVWKDRRSQVHFITAAAASLKKIVRHLENMLTGFLQRDDTTLALRLAPVSLA